MCGFSTRWAGKLISREQAWTKRAKRVEKFAYHGKFEFVIYLIATKKGWDLDGIAGFRPCVNSF
jgi:hypothetical protein